MTIIQMAPHYRGRKTECLNCYYGGTWHFSGTERQIECAKHKAHQDHLREYNPAKGPGLSSTGKNVEDLSSQRRKRADVFSAEYLEAALVSDLERYNQTRRNSNTHIEIRNTSFNTLERELKVVRPATVDEVMRESNAIDSITGNIMEHKFADAVGGLARKDTIYKSQDPNIMDGYQAVCVEDYMPGKDQFKERVKELRSYYLESDAQARKKTVDKLAFEFMLKKAYVKSVMDDPKTEITRLPDAMARLRLVRDDGTVEKVLRPVEMKLSGRHDSKSVEANIKALRKSLEDRINPPRGYRVEPAIAITAGAVDEVKGTIPVERRWENAIEKLDYKDMNVVSNERVFEYLTGRTYSSEDYHERYVTPVARLAAIRLFQRVHGRIDLPKAKLVNFINTGSLYGVREKMSA